MMWIVEELEMSVNDIQSCMYEVDVSAAPKSGEYVTVDGKSLTITVFETMAEAEQYFYA